MHHQQGRKRVCRPVFHCALRAQQLALLGAKPQPPCGTHSSAQLRARRTLHLESWQAMPTSSKHEEGKHACQGTETASLKVTAVVAGVILQRQLSQRILSGFTPSQPQAARINEGRKWECQCLKRSRLNSQAMLKLGWHEHPLKGLGESEMSLRALSKATPHVKVVEKHPRSIA